MKTTTAEREEAVAALRAAIKPGDVLYTVLRGVSRSGMQRKIDVYKFEQEKDGGPQWLSRLIAKACGYNIDEQSGAIKIGGCGMDMGFHIVHSLGYALYGEEARSSATKEATKLRKALLAADPHYYTQGGQAAPNPTIPDDHWFGGAGYAFKHRWL